MMTQFTGAYMRHRASMGYIRKPLAVFAKEINPKLAKPLMKFRGY